MSFKVQDIIKTIEHWLPEKFANKDDKIGLLTGSYNNEVNKILVTLDVNLAVVNEAVENNVDMIFAHHNPFYIMQSNFITDTTQGKLLSELLKNDIALYVAHTNLDSAFGGVNDVLADMLELKNVSSLVTGWQERYIKFAVNVPSDYEEKVRLAIINAGAGYIGNYSDCTFHINGTGYFMPRQGTEPFLGKIEELAKISEVKIETIINIEILEKVLMAMLEVHPYEEPAYDIIPLYNDGKKTGLGRVGFIQNPVTLEEFLKTVGNNLHVKDLKYTGDLNRHVYKIALCGGSGMSFVKDALQKGADVYLTGDVKFHEAQEANELGIAVVDAGHYGTERPVVEKVAKFLLLNFKEDIQVVISKVNTDPFMYYKG